MSKFNVSKRKSAIFLAIASLIAFSVSLHIVTAQGPTAPPTQGRGRIDANDYSVSIGGVGGQATLTIYPTGTPSVNFGLNVKDSLSNNLLRVSTSGIVVVGTTTFSNDPNYKLQTHSIKADHYISSFSYSPYTNTDFVPCNYLSAGPFYGPPCSVGIDVGVVNVTSSLLGAYPPGSPYAGEPNQAGIFNFTSISADAIVGLGGSASKVAPGIFRNGNYAFPGKLGVNTSTTTGLTESLSVYSPDPMFDSSAYFRASTTIKTGPTVASSAMLNIGGNSWLSSFNKGIRLEKSGSFYPALQFGDGTGGLGYYGIGFRQNRLLFFNDEYDYDPAGNPRFYGLTIAATSTGIGIGQTNPSSPLHVAGTLKISGASGFQLGTSATNGYILTSDENGVGTWQQVGTEITGGVQNYTIRNTGTGWTGSSFLKNSSTIILIGNATSVAGTSLRIGSNGYFQIDKTSGGGGPNSSDCDNDNEKGRMSVDQSVNRLYVCMGASTGWKVSPDFWYNTGGNWRYRKKITIDDTKVAGGVVNFPMLVSSTDTGLRDYAQSDGDDILFTSTAGVKLAHEIENYTSATGNLIAWVRIPQLSSTQDTEIYMYYGNSSASNQQLATDVWKDSYRGVWHLKETSGNFLDSSPSPEADCTYSNTGERRGTITAVGAKIGTGQQFAGTSVNSCHPTNGSCIDISQPLNTSNPSCTGFNDANTTYSAWVKINDLTQTGLKGIIGRRVGNDVYHLLYDSTAEKFGFYIRKDGSPFNNLTGNYWFSLISPTSVTSTSAWYHVAFTNNSAGVLTGYINGTSIGSVTDATPNALTEISNVKIGNDGTTYIAANIDEVRIARIAHEPEWIQTEFNNQSSPSTFYSIGPQE